ncbi:hypothetical protein P3342_008296 [Pyrenophora teres f. teres]|nr:hypothetical protein P3342_008296 [Pyrenophora teres f. teres]
MVKDRISSTPDLEDDVRSSKRPRSRTPVIKKLRSATLTIEPTSEEATGYLWDFYLKNHSAPSIIRALRTFVTFMKTQFSITVAVIETDNETFRSAEAQRWKDD